MAIIGVMTKKQYVQFSKKMVMAVVSSEILLCVAAIFLTLCGYDASIVVDVIKAYSPFAMVVFAAYSGNSAVEKWLVYTTKVKSSEEDESNISNG